MSVEIATTETFSALSPFDRTEIVHPNYFADSTAEKVFVSSVVIISLPDLHLRIAQGFPGLGFYSKEKKRWVSSAEMAAKIRSVFNNCPSRHVVFTSKRFLDMYMSAFGAQDLAGSTLYANSALDDYPIVDCRLRTLDKRLGNRGAKKHVKSCLQQLPRLLKPELSTPRAFVFRENTLYNFKCDLPHCVVAFYYGSAGVRVPSEMELYFALATKCVSSDAKNYICFECTARQKVLTAAATRAAERKEKNDSEGVPKMSCPTDAAATPGPSQAPDYFQQMLADIDTTAFDDFDISTEFVPWEDITPSVFDFSLEGAVQDGAQIQQEVDAALADRPE